MIGRVLRWKGRYGYLVYHSRENVKCKVFCSAEACGGRTLERGDVVEFSLREDEHGPAAEAVTVVVDPQPPTPLALESAAWPASRLEPLRVGAAAADGAMCEKYLHDFRKAAAAPECLRAAASEYFASVERFRSEQERRMEAEVARHSMQGSSDHSGACVSNYKEAWNFMRTWRMRPDVEALCKAHGILARMIGKSAGRLRSRTVRVGECRFIPPEEVPKAMERYAASLEDVLAREDLTPHAKAAWAGYHVLAIHPFADGNGRLARLLIAWVLSCCGVPFPLVLCGSEEHRTAWREAIIAGHRGLGDSQPLATILATALNRAWGELERKAEREATSRQEAAEDRAAHVVRERAKQGVCAVCLDIEPNMMLMCCGAAFHLSCMTRWMHSAPEPACPACRATLPPLPEPPAPDPVQLLANETEAIPQLGTVVAVLSMYQRVFGGEVLPQPATTSAQGLCAFCTNMRATDCALRACAPCCRANCRLYGVHCPRHVSDDVQESAQWNDETTTSEISDENSMLSYESLNDHGLEGGGGGGRCAFCNNSRAANCALGACRSCCLNRPERCDRHCPVLVVPPSQGDPAQPPPVETLDPSFGSYGQPFCAFCNNRRATECYLNACRQCCLHRVGPCEWHALGGGRRRPAGGPAAGLAASSSSGAPERGAGRAAEDASRWHAVQECRYCANTCAVGCYQAACRRCCIASGLPCDRHRP